MTVPEPGAKRKTLVERAGEVPRSDSAAPPSSKPVNGAVKATTLAGVRNTSLSSSASSRAPSTASRKTSTSSFTSVSGSNGDSRRAPSALDSHRSQTVLGYTRNVAQTPAPVARPASSMDGLTTTGEQPVLGKRKGMMPFSITTFQPLDNIRLRKQRGRHDNQQNYISSWQSSRSVQPQPSALSQSQASAQDLLRNCSFLSTAFSNLTLDSQAEGPESSRSNTQEEPSAPKTPSYIPRPTSNPPQLQPSPSPSPALFSAKTLPRLRNRSPSPRKIFLTKESNSAVLAWDTKGKLEDLECLYTNLKAQMEGTTFEKNSMKEIIELYKTRSTFLSSTSRFP